MKLKYYKIIFDLTQCRRYAPFKVRSLQFDLKQFRHGGNHFMNGRSAAVHAFLSFFGCRGMDRIKNPINR
jgi:hypothetical protein